MGVCVLSGERVDGLRSHQQSCPLERSRDSRLGPRLRRREPPVRLGCRRRSSCSQCCRRRGSARILTVEIIELRSGIVGSFAVAIFTLWASAESFEEMLWKRGEQNDIQRRPVAVEGRLPRAGHSGCVFDRMRRRMGGGMQSADGTYRLYIDGEWVGSGKTFALIDPSTEEAMARVAEAGAAEVDLAVRAARRAFDSGPWAESTPMSRARVLFALAAKVRAELPSLAEIEAINTGKPIVEAESDIDAVAEVFEYYAGLATKIPGLVNPVSAKALSLSLKEPIGE